MMVIPRDTVWAALQFIHRVFDTVDGTLKLHGSRKRSVVSVEDFAWNANYPTKAGMMITVIHPLPFARPFIYFLRLW